MQHKPTEMQIKLACLEDLLERLSTSEGIHRTVFHSGFLKLEGEPVGMNAVIQEGDKLFLKGDGKGKGKELQQAHGRVDGCIRELSREPKNLTLKQKVVFGTAIYMNAADVLYHRFQEYYRSLSDLGSSNNELSVLFGRSIDSCHKKLMLEILEEMGDQPLFLGESLEISPAFKASLQRRIRKVKVELAAETERTLLENSDKLSGLDSHFSENFSTPSSLGVTEDSTQGESKSLLPEVSSPELKLPKAAPPIFTRASSNSTPLSTVPPDKTSDNIKINITLKALGTMRGVIHVLLSNGADQDILSLQEAFEELNSVADLNQLNYQHEAFNLKLLRALNRAKLLDGMEKTPKKLAELLTYCRYLSGLLDPAPIVSTKVDIDENHYYVETCYPMTEKTRTQRDKLEADIPEDKDAQGGGFYQEMSPPFRAVTRAFCKQLMDNTCLGSSQLRKYILDGLRNAWAVHRQLFKKGEPVAPDAKSEEGTPQESSAPQLIDSYWSVRTGTLAYVGKGESKVDMQAAVHANLRQLKENMHRIISEHGTEEEKKCSKQLHVSMLNTDMQPKFLDGEGQHRMVNMTYNALKFAKDDEKTPTGWLKGNGGDIGWSYLPPNIFGRFRSAEISPSLEEKLSPPVGSRTNPFDPTARAKQGGKVALGCMMRNANADSMVIDVSTCASGIDRTGTRELMVSLLFIIKALSKEKANLSMIQEGEKMLKADPDLTKMQKWVEKVLHLTKTQCPAGTIVNKLIAAGHSTVMAHILCPSSPGMKSASRPGNLFGANSNQIYLDVADTNKKTPLLSTTLKEEEKKGRRYGLMAMLATLFLLIPATFAIYAPQLNLWQLWLSINFSVSLGPALIFAAGGALILGASIFFLEKRYKDWVAASVRAVGLWVVVITAFVLIELQFTNADYVFATAWKPLASTALLSPVVVLVFTIAALLGLSVLAGAKLGKRKVEEEFLEKLDASPNEQPMAKKPTIVLDLFNLKEGGLRNLFETSVREHLESSFGVDKTKKDIYRGGAVYIRDSNSKEPRLILESEGVDSLHPEVKKLMAAPYGDLEKAITHLTIEQTLKDTIMAGFHQHGLLWRLMSPATFAINQEVGKILRDSAVDHAAAHISKRRTTINVIDKNRLEIEEEFVFSEVRMLLVDNSERQLVGAEGNPLFTVSSKIQLSSNGSWVSIKRLSAQLTSHMKEEGPLRPLVSALKNEAQPNFFKEQVRPLSTAILSIMLAWGIFATSVNFGLAVGGGFLMPAWMSPLFAFGITLFAVSAMTYLVTHMKKSRVNRTSPSSFSLTEKIMWSGIAAALFTSCVVMLAYIFTEGAALFPGSGVLLSIMSAATLGFSAWLAIRHLLNKLSAGPYATWAAIVGMGFMTFMTLSAFSAQGIAVGLSATVLLPVTLSLGVMFLVCIGLARNENPKVVSYGKTSLKVFKLLLITGSLFLAFVSMTAIFQLGSLGHLSGLIDMAFNIIVQTLGYSGFAIGTLWLQAFAVTTFAFATFTAFELTKDYLEKMPADDTKTVSANKRGFIQAISLKSIFNIGLVAIIAAISFTSFPAAANVSLVYVFLAQALLMPLFSGNLEIPYFKEFNSWFNNWFGVEKELDLWREFMVALVLTLIPTIFLIAGVVSLEMFVIWVIVSVSVNAFARAVNMKGNDPVLVAEVDMRGMEKESKGEPASGHSVNGVLSMLQSRILEEQGTPSDPHAGLFTRFVNSVSERFRFAQPTAPKESKEDLEDSADEIPDLEDQEERTIDIVFKVSGGL